jgi:hypothetical protein
MKDIILILNLIVKSLVELIFVIGILSTIGLAVFIVVYIYRTIDKAISEYKSLRDIN